MFYARLLSLLLGVQVVASPNKGFGLPSQAAPLSSESFKGQPKPAAERRATAGTPPGPGDPGDPPGDPPEEPAEGEEEEVEEEAEGEDPSEAEAEDPPEEETEAEGEEPEGPGGDPEGPEGGGGGGGGEPGEPEDEYGLGEYGEEEEPPGHDNEDRDDCQDQDHLYGYPVDQRGNGCDWYHDKPFACGQMDDADFNASSLCCGCQSREAKPEIPENCHDTDHGIVDRWGYSCAAWYNNDEVNGYEYCGTRDTVHFKAFEMCCVCRNTTMAGGYIGDHVCPSFALEARPDHHGMCHCASGSTCHEKDLTTGDNRQDCPGNATANLQRSTTSFHNSCQSCRCKAEGTVSWPQWRDTTCDAQFTETGLEDTTDSWMVFTVLEQAKQKMSIVFTAVADTHAAFMRDAKREELVDDLLLDQDRSLLKRWADLFYTAIQRSDNAVRSCGVVLRGTGASFSLESGACNQTSGDDQLIFYATLNGGGKLDAYPVNGLSCTMSELGLRSCNTGTLWLEGWSVKETPVVYVDDNTGELKYGTHEYNISSEGWFGNVDTNKYDADDILWLHSWSSYIDRQRLVGLGKWIENPSTGAYEGVIKCQMSTGYMSNYLRGLVGAGSRLLLMDEEGEILASSHGKVEIPYAKTANRVLPEPVTFNDSDDSVVRYAGSVVLANQSVYQNRTSWATGRRLLEASAFMIEEQVPWPEMRGYLRMYLGRSALPFWLIYAMPVLCYPGHEMVVSSSQEVIPCTKCPVGKKSEEGEVVGDRCTNCPAGSYSDKPGSTICFTCASGTFQNVSGATACEACPNNTESVPGSSRPEACVCTKDKYNLQVPTITNPCITCPAGTTCLGEDYWPLAQSSHFSLAPSVSIKCTSTMKSNPCLGGEPDQNVTFTTVPAPAPYSTSVINYCKEGYEGVACSYCSSGYFRFGRDCYKCEGVLTGPFLRFLWVLLIIVFYLLRRVVNSKYKTLYIFLSFLQVFGLQGSFPLNWTSKIKETMRVIQVANLQVDLLVPSCVAEKNINFFVKYLTYLALPWIFLLIDIIVIFCSKVITVMRANKASRASLKKPGEHNGGEDDPATINEVSRIIGEAAGMQRSSFELFKDFLAQALANMRLMFLSLAGRTLDMIQCTPLVGDELDTSRLSKDMNYVCWEGTHLAYMPLVGVGLVYIIGTPLAYVIILVRGYMHNELYSKEHLRRYGLLYSRFEPAFFFWELVIMFRRFLAVMIKVLLNIRTAEEQQNGYIGNYQAALVAFVMVFSLAVHFYARPFCNPFLDFGDAVYLGGTFFSCLIGICFSTAENAEKEKETATFEALFFLNLAVICTVTFFLIWRDFEVVHPTLKAARRRVTDRLGVHKLGEYLHNRVQLKMRKGREAIFVETVQGVNYERLAGKKVVLNSFKSVIKHALAERLEQQGLSITEDHVQIQVEQGDRAQSVVVRSIVQPPSGIASSKVEQAMNNQSQHELVQSLMGGLMDAFGPAERQSQWRTTPLPVESTTI